MGFVRLFLLYAILIFAKKAPDMIKDMLKIKGDNIGLKGLNIKNKMGEAALVGKHVKKGMTGLEGRAKGTVGGAVGGFLRGKKGERLKAARAGASKGYAKGKHDALENKDVKGIFSGAYKEMGNIASGGRTSFFNKPKDWLQQADDRFIKGVAGRDKTTGKPNKYANPLMAENQIKLDKIKAELTKRHGAHKADLMLGKALERTKNTFGELDLSKEEQWMYLTTGKLWGKNADGVEGYHKYSDLVDATGHTYDDVEIGGIKYNSGDSLPSNLEFVGINDAVEYAAFNDYKFEGVKSTMNDAYTYSNIATNVEKARDAFEKANQDCYRPGLSPAERNAFEAAREVAWGKYLDKLADARDQGALNVSIVEESRIKLDDAGNPVKDSSGNIIVENVRTVDGASMSEYLANTNGVRVDVTKRFNAFKENADAAVQKEEVKQKAEDSSNK